MSEQRVYGRSKYFKYLNAEIANFKIIDIYVEGNYYRAKCECKCGKIFTPLMTGILRTKNSVQSCGCIKNSVIGKKHGRWRGFGDVPQDWFSNIRRKASERGIDFSISIEDVDRLYKAQHGKCALSNQNIYFGTSNSQKDTNVSIDRIDSNKSYQVDNIQLVTKEVNFMKYSLTQETFLKNCICIAQNTKDKNDNL